MPDASAIEYAVHVLGDVINVAFSDALRLDHLARQVVRSFGDLDFDQRVELGDQHAKLTEKLILLEDGIDRMDRR